MIFSGRKYQRWALFFAVGLCPIANALAAESYLSIPFQVEAIEPGALPGTSVAAPGPALLTFELDSTLAPGQAFTAFNDNDSFLIPLFDCQLSSILFHGLKYPGQKYQLYYEHNHAYTLDGVGFLHFYVRPDCAGGSRPCLPPGRYRVTASRGGEYNTHTLALLVYADKYYGSYRCRVEEMDGRAVAGLDFRLGHVVDSAGYLGCDFHQHAGEDGNWDPQLRVIANLVQGIEVWAQSDHNSYRYYQKRIQELGLADRIFCLPSIELGSSQGHLNVLPQYGYLMDPARLGPCDPYADPAADCPPAALNSTTYPLDLPYMDTPFQTFRAIRNQALAAGRPNYIQINHPNNGFYSYSHTPHLLDESGNFPDKNSRRVYRPDYDGIELRDRDYLQWRYLFNQGYRFTRVYNSDSHQFQQLGSAGTYARSSFETIPPAASRRALVDELMMSLKAGRAFLTKGPIIRVSAGGSDALGRDFTGGSLHLQVEVQAPATFAVPPTLEVEVNGSAYRTYPLAFASVATAMGPRQQAELAVDLDFDRDSWVILRSGGPGAGDTCFTTNALWVDREGDGAFAPLIPLPKIQLLESLGPDPVSPGETVHIAFRVTPAPQAVEAWVAPNDLKQNASCAALSDCDREAACSLKAGSTTDFRCVYAVTGKYPLVERPGANEVRVAAQGANGYWGLYLDEIEIVYPDTDGDGMNDAYERLNSKPPCMLAPTAADGGADPDADNLTNLQEFTAGTNPCLADTDGDAIKDNNEISSHCSDPLSSDTDRDGRCDGNIAAPGGSCLAGEDTDLDGVLDAGETSPCNPDTDGDGMNDNWEKSNSCMLPRTKDASGDFDHDGLTNLEEFIHATNPCLADPDADGLKDGDEIGRGADPAFADSDNDGIADGAEVAYGSDLLNWDTDGDGLADGEEQRLGAAYNRSDTDGDGLADGDEVHLYGSDPKLADTDGDGLSDPSEVLTYHTYPFLADSDLDGVGDYEEVFFGADGFITDPNNWDTDFDGLPDGYECSHAAESPPLDPVLPEDGAADFDHDGNPNAHEYWNGSDPWSSDPTGGAGCFFWGEGDGDGIVGPGDIGDLIQRMKGAAVSYAALVPGNGETQEMDMDLIPGPGDLSILVQMMKNTDLSILASRPSALDRVEPATGATVELMAGEQSRVTVGVRNEAGLFSPGFGVVFAIDAVNSTGSGELLGGDGAAAGGRYDVSGPIGGGGQAAIFVRADTPGVIVVTTALPGCGAVPNRGRYCPSIAGPSFVFSVTPNLYSR